MILPPSTFLVFKNHIIEIKQHVLLIQFNFDNKIWVILSQKWVKVRTILCYCLAEVDFRPAHSGLSTRAISLLACVITVSHYLPWTNPCTAPPATDPSLKPSSINQGTSNLYFYTLLAYNSLGMFGYSLFFSYLSTGCSFSDQPPSFFPIHPSIFTPTLPQNPLIIPRPSAGCYCYPCSFEVPDALNTNRQPDPCNFSCVIHPSIECMLQKIRSPLSFSSQNHAIMKLDIFHSLQDAPKSTSLLDF